MSLITLVLMKAPMQGTIWVKSWMKRGQKEKKEEATIEVEERVEDSSSSSSSPPLFVLGECGCGK